MALVSAELEGRGEEMELGQSAGYPWGWQQGELEPWG